MIKIKKGEYKNILGKNIKAVTERKKGMPHPDCPDTVYTADYGYAEGFEGGDGKPQEVYILSDDQDNKNLTVIAVIERYDDSGDKWVAVPENTVMYEPYIKEQVDFIEKHFKSKYHCLYEKTCGSVVFTRENGVKKYLLIKNDSGHIGFPKGHIEYGENESETAEREVSEETGLKIKINTGTRQEYTYKTTNSVIKNCVYFCNEFENHDIKIQQEEISEYWLADFNEALELLNYPQDKIILVKADKMYD